MKTKTHRPFTTHLVWVAAYEINPNGKTGEYYDADWACWWGDDAEQEATEMASQYAKLLDHCTKNNWELRISVWPAQFYPVAITAADEASDEFQEAINEWNPWDQGKPRVVLHYTGIK